MDARIFFHLTDSIATATDAAELEVVGELIRAATMHPIERRALERVLSTRAQALRTGDAALPSPLPAPRGD